MVYYQCVWCSKWASSIQRVYREYTELRYMVSMMGLWMLACSGSCVAMVSIA